MMVVARMMTTVRTTRTRKTRWLETDPLLPSVATRGRPCRHVQRGSVFLEEPVLLSTFQAMRLTKARALSSTLGNVKQYAATEA